LLHRLGEHVGAGAAQDLHPLGRAATHWLDHITVAELDEPVFEFPAPPHRDDVAVVLEQIRARRSFTMVGGGTVDGESDRHESTPKVVGWTRHAMPIFHLTVPTIGRSSVMREREL